MMLQSQYNNIADFFTIINMLIHLWLTIVQGNGRTKGGLLKSNGKAPKHIAHGKALVFDVNVIWQKHLVI